VGKLYAPEEWNHPYERVIRLLCVSVTDNSMSGTSDVLFERLSRMWLCVSLE